MTALRLRSGARHLAVGLTLCALLPATAWADPRDDARRHFMAGLTAAADGNYQGALDEFLAAWEAVPHPSTAFNIARSYEDLGDLTSALAWYLRAQELAPDRAAEVADAVARVRAKLPAPASPSAAPTVEAAPATLEAAVARLAEVDAERARAAEAVRALGGTAEDAPVATPQPATPTGAPETVAEVPDDRPREALLTEAYEQNVVTASRYTQSPLDAPSSVTVIDADEIRASGAVHVADVLRRAVGVDVMAMSSGVPYVGIRAFNGEMTNKVLWLVDGRPASLEFLATPFPFTLQVGLDEIERIEVIRGAGSAIYGANAVTGVINVITRRPGEGPALSASLSAGANHFVQGSAVASGAKGIVSYRVGAGFQQEGRFSKAFEDVSIEDEVVPFRDDQNIGDRRFRADGRVDVDLGKGWTSLSGAWSQGFAEYFSKAALGNFGLEGSAGHIRADFGWDALHVRAYWAREDGETSPWLAAAGASRSTSARVRDDSAQLEAEGNWSLRTGEVDHRVHVGGNYTFKQYRAGVVGEGFEIPRREHHAALFAQYQVGNKVAHGTVSLRWDRHPLINAAQTISPRGALVVRVAPRTAVRASGGTAFRAMNGLESYVNLQLSTAADGYFVNFFGAGTDPEGRKLRPERVTNAELGVRDETLSWMRVDGAVWWNRVTDLIDIGSVEPVLAPFNDINAGYPYGEARWVNTDTVYDAVGGEADLTFFPVDGLDLFVNTTIARVFGRDGDTRFIDGGTPLGRLNAGATWRSPWRVDLSAAVHYTAAESWRIPTFDGTGAVVVQDRPLDERVLFVGRIAGRPIQDPELELSFTVWNPVGWGKGFREHPNGQIVGPRMFGTISVAF